MMPIRTDFSQFFSPRAWGAWSAPASQAVGHAPPVELVPPAVAERPDKGRALSLTGPPPIMVSGASAPALQALDLAKLGEMSDAEYAALKASLTPQQQKSFRAALGASR